jgi:hypothetical protein
MKKILSNCVALAAASVATVACGWTSTTSIAAPSAAAPASAPAGCDQQQCALNRPSWACGRLLPCLRAAFGEYLRQLPVPDRQPDGPTISGTFTAACGGL